jgi:hypothetical protein
MLPRVHDPCKRHSSKERAKLRRCAAMLADNLAARGSRAIFDFRSVKSPAAGPSCPAGRRGSGLMAGAISLTISADRGSKAGRQPQVACVAHRLAAILRQAARISSGGDMKVNIEIDCTPLEARQFFGLPDVMPMQTAVMDKLQQQMMSNIDKVSPESLIQSWFTFDPKIAERFQDMFVTMAGLGGTRSSDKKK